jgi:hypothetical protein
MRAALVILGAVAVLATLPGTSSARSPVGDSAFGIFGSSGGPAVNMDAGSGPSGENPTGTVRIGSTTPGPQPLWQLQVTCLSVTGNTAIIGVSGTLKSYTDGTLRPTAGLIRAVDNGSPGSGTDLTDLSSVEGPVGGAAIPGPTNCSSYPGAFPLHYGPFTNVGGDLEVTDELPLPAPVDQELIEPSSLTGTINQCCTYVAQTFTAGRDGFLAGVSINTRNPGVGVPSLRVSIRNVVGDLPGETILATTVTPTALNPLTKHITFPQVVELRAGVKYAIVVNVENPPTSGAVWDGATGDRYPRGEACAKFKPGVLTGDWFCSPDFDTVETDRHFRTYVKPPPTTKEQCRHGGWRSYGFPNQGACIAYVVRKARQACVFELVAHGRPAFRAKYGIGPRHVLAMWACTHRRTGF